MNLQSEKLKIHSALSVLKVLKISWFISTIAIIPLIAIGIMLFISLQSSFMPEYNWETFEKIELEKASSSSVGITLVFALVAALFFITNMICFVFQIITLVKIGAINSKYSSGITGTGGILIIVGFVVGITTIIGAFILSNELKASLIKLENDQKNETKTLS